MLVNNSGTILSELIDTPFVHHAEPEYNMVVFRQRNVAAASLRFAGLKRLVLLVGDHVTALSAEEALVRARSSAGGCRRQLMPVVANYSPFCEDAVEKVTFASPQWMKGTVALCW